MKSVLITRESKKAPNSRAAPRKKNALRLGR
jgi:hypothetical protein